MATITANDLRYSYSWKAIAGDDPRQTGKPDSVLLNRNEGYEVLAFINAFCARHTWNPGPHATVAEALKVERLIKTKLPGEIRSRQHIDAWLVSNWQAN